MKVKIVLAVMALVLTACSSTKQPEQLSGAAKVGGSHLNSGVKR